MDSKPGQVPASDFVVSSSIAPPRPHRLPLGASRRRLSYERRIRLWLTVLALPSLLLASILAFKITQSVLLTAVTTFALALLWLVVVASFFEQLVRPLQTLSNVVAALREDDFSFRARGARRGDSLGDLALEINALAGNLQTQRSSARDALTLVEHVMTSMQSPVLAFASGGRLRLLNHAAEAAFRLNRRSCLTRSAADLGLAALLEIEDEEVYQQVDSLPRSSDPTRWSVRRTTFRLHGVPHTLFVLSDVAAALREEERLAWHRLVRVLSHEINNSLTPIKSIAGSLRTRLPTHGPSASPENLADFGRGLTVIEERAASLNRFLQAYQQLTRLPSPRLTRVFLDELIEQSVLLETRLSVELIRGASIQLQADPDQLQQLLINLVRNAVEAALSRDPEVSPETARVSISWTATPSHAIVHIRDNGPGLTNPANVFIPFYTTKPHGSGIGLVLARQIAVAHRGDLSLSNSERSTGCTAELRLPLHSI